VTSTKPRVWRWTPFHAAPLSGTRRPPEYKVATCACASCIGASLARVWPLSRPAGDVPPYCIPSRGQGWCMRRRCRSRPPCEASSAQTACCAPRRARVALDRRIAVCVASLRAFRCARWRQWRNHFATFSYDFFSSSKTVSVPPLPSASFVSPAPSRFAPGASTTLRGVRGRVQQRRSRHENPLVVLPLRGAGRPSMRAWFGQCLRRAPRCANPNNAI
jgi:hypothetical protein